MTRTLSLVFVALLTGSCGGDDDNGGTPTPDATPCVPGETEVAVATASEYACRQDFMATVMLTNRSCSNMVVSEVRIAAAVTAGECGPAGPGSYTPTMAFVAHNQTATILTLTSGPFCCLAPGCPPTLQCDERFDFTVVTNNGMFMGSASSHLDLDGCDVVCTP